MTDVRLTATDPTDSSVVPVACNAKGELKLEEPIEFDGNLDGDLTVSGSAEFANGRIQLNANGRYLCNSATQPMDLGTQKTAADQYSILTLRSSTSSLGSGPAVVDMKSDGSIDLDGRLKIGTTNTAADANALLIYDNSGSGAQVQIKASGSAVFAGGTAGFTAEGYLWCTTRRGDTVILDATSNGLATWADYTPPSRRDLIKEKVEEKVAEWSEKDTNDPDFGVSPEASTET